MQDTVDVQVIMRSADGAQHNPGTPPDYGLPACIRATANPSGPEGARANNACLRRYQKNPATESTERHGKMAY